MRDRQDIKVQAKQNFHANYGICIGAFILFVIVSNPLSIFSSLYNLAVSIGHVPIWDIFTGIGGIGVERDFGLSLGLDIYNYVVTPLNLNILISQASLLFSIFLLPPILVGHSNFSLRIYKGDTITIKGMFSTGFSNYWRNVGGILWMQLFIFLWSLLLLIPGLIKSLAYFMTPYILADCENVTATDALKLSMRMTKGYKGEIFVMQLSFIGWHLLSALTFGLLGVFYVSPYIYTSYAGMYEELKQNAIASRAVSIEELGISAVETDIVSIEEL